MRPTDLRALRDKYEQMLCLRQLHARAKQDPEFVEPDPRSAMAALARDYPGALREIDELPIEDIERRIAELAAAELDDLDGQLVELAKRARERAREIRHRLSRIGLDEIRVVARTCVESSKAKDALVLVTKGTQVGDAQRC